MENKKRKLDALEDDGHEEGKIETKRACPLDHYTLSFILDFTEPSGMDHPFRKVCKATREAWLDHPFSLPLRIKMELASKLPTHALTHEQRTSLLGILQESLGVLSKEVEEEQKRREDKREAKQAKKRRKKTIAAMMGYLQKSSILGAEDEGKMREVHELLNRASEITCYVYHHYDRDTYCFRETTVRVVIDDVEMSYHSGTDTDRNWNGVPKKEMPNWEECREKWHVKELTATDLRSVFRFLIIDDNAWSKKYNYGWDEAY